MDYQPVKTINEGYSAYYKYYLRKEINQYLDEYEKKTGKKLNLYKDGLKIYVTLDSKMQKYAEDAIKEHLKALQRNFDNQQKHNPKRPFYHISKKQIDHIMLQAMRRTGRYKQLAREGGDAGVQGLRREDAVPEDGERVRPHLVLPGGA